MKISDVVIGDFYVVAKSPPRYNAWSFTASKHNNKTTDTISVGDVLKCTGMHKSNGYDYSSRAYDTTYSEYEVMSGTQVGKTIRVTTHSFLKKETDNPYQDRKTRSNMLARIISNQKEQLETLKKEVSSLEEKLAVNSEKLEKLVAFSSDEAELAHTLAEVVRSGGNEEKILEALLKMTGEGGNAVKKMVSKTETKSKKPQGISTLLEY